MAYKYPVDTVDTDSRDELTTGESTMSRRFATSNLIGGSSGALRLAYFTARKTETITQVATYSGTTAQTSATLCKVGVYSVDGSGNLTLITSTPNTTTLWAGATGSYQTAFSASFTKTRGSRYAVACLTVTAGTANNFIGDLVTSSVLSGLSPRISGFVAGQSDLPASVTAASVSDSGHAVFAVLLP